MTGVDRLHSEHKLDGNGIKIGIIDDGIDYLHPGLGGCFGQGCRVAYGWDFVGDSYDGNSAPIPDADPRDTCKGHGTHVAGIIAANDTTFVGVAPRATLGAYRVFGCNDNTQADMIIAALERAFRDGMDIVNLSLGLDSGWAMSSDATAVSRLTSQGLVVVAAVGNIASAGMWEVSTPSIAPGTIAVASVDNARYLAYTFTVSTERNLSIPYPTPQDKRPLALSGVDITSAAATAGASDLACEPIASNLRGKIALIQRGVCNFLEKAINAQEAGAVAVIIYNNAPGIIHPVTSDPKITVPVIGIQQAHGLAILRSFRSGIAAQAEFSKDILTLDNPEAGLLSDFSSWGPGPQLEIKPDIAAPGDSRARVYRISHTPAVSVRGLNASDMPLSRPQQRDAPATLVFSHNRVRVGAGKTRQIKVRITPPATLPPREHWVYSGYIVVDSTEPAGGLASSDAVHIPYLGVKGNLNDIHVLRRTNRHPALQNTRDNTTITWPDETAVYTVANDDYPQVVLSLNFPSARLYARIYSAHDHKLLGLVPDSLSLWNGRNELKEDSNVTTAWKGDFSALNDTQRLADLPDGRYYLDVMALRPFGRENADQDYDIWRSPIVTFKRAPSTHGVNAVL
ncbi:peptidase S8/S53 domain-containing protein [Thamnocephalis sphaerospora]|uniref:Peptidase S8/S53 domain-containing protein n=1 Tax=Thamnocephalis sphaerospora TaxID=78915 RepID=A0A4P9XQM3_9FUNG|nr:peptidase S8/S53 domain-containing protein [Thamnocephalis sphaerospora]|eukprot:RKP07590.1 peptidase S8/S53 domain-containing protein [Thamnocephalis sphaerospora]